MVDRRCFMFTLYSIDFFPKGNMLCMLTNLSFSLQHSSTLIFFVVLTIKNEMSIIIVRCVSLINDRACSLWILVYITVLFLVSYTVVLLSFAGDCAVMNRVVDDILHGLVFLLPSIVLLSSSVVGSANSMIHLSLISGVLTCIVLSKVYLPGSSNTFRNSRRFRETGFTLDVIFVNGPVIQSLSIILLFTSGIDE